MMIGDVGAIASRALAVIAALLAIRQMTGLASYLEMARLDPAFGGPMYYRPFASSLVVTGALWLIALMLWVRADRFWPVESTSSHSSLSPSSLRRLVFGALGAYFVIGSAPAFFQAVVMLTLPDTAAGELAKQDWSVWQAIDRGLQAAAGLWLLVANRGEPLASLDSSEPTAVR